MSPTELTCKEEHHIARYPSAKIEENKKRTDKIDRSVLTRIEDHIIILITCVYLKDGLKLKIS